MSNIPVHVAIRSQREAAGLSQAELAARCRIAQANLSHIERGSRDLTVSTLARIAAALGTTASSLVAGVHDTQALPPDRDSLERIAAAAVEGSGSAKQSKRSGRARLSPAERTAASHLSALVPGLSPTEVRDSDAYQAHQYLKRTFGPQTLKTMISKVHKAQERAHAPQNDR